MTRFLAVASTLVAAARAIAEVGRWRRAGVVAPTVTALHHEAYERWLARITQEATTHETPSRPAVGVPTPPTTGARA